MGWETYNLKSCTHFKGYKRTLESVLILPRSIHTRTPKISYPGAPSSYAEKLAKGEIEGKKSARRKPIKRGKCQFLLDFIFPPLEEVSLSHFSYLYKCPFNLSPARLNTAISINCLRHSKILRISSSSEPLPIHKSDKTHYKFSSIPHTALTF